MTDKFRFPVLAGGGIGEVQSYKDYPTPLQAIAAWVKGQGTTKYAAPMDMWICVPDIETETTDPDTGWINSTTEVDVTAVRAFYTWIEQHEERFSEEILKQDVYIPHYLVTKAMKKAEEILALSDVDIAELLSNEHLNPFSGG